MTSIYVERARALVGTRFRAQGRDAETGLDCVGLALTVFGIPTIAVRHDYALRGSHKHELCEQVLRFFRRVPNGAVRPGDLIMSECGSDQLHLSISAGESFVHADARLRRVVETPGRPSWPCSGTFRRRVRGQGR